MEIKINENKAVVNGAVIDWVEDGDGNIKKVIITDSDDEYLMIEPANGDSLVLTHDTVS